MQREFSSFDIGGHTATAAGLSRLVHVHGAVSGLRARLKRDEKKAPHAARTPRDRPVSYLSTHRESNDFADGNATPPAASPTLSQSREISPEPFPDIPYEDVNQRRPRGPIDEDGFSISHGRHSFDYANELAYQSSASDDYEQLEENENRYERRNRAQFTLGGSSEDSESSDPDLDRLDSPYKDEEGFDEEGLDGYDADEDYSSSPSRLGRATTQGRSWSEVFREYEDIFDDDDSFAEYAHLYDANDTDRPVVQYATKHYYRARRRDGTMGKVLTARHRRARKAHRRRPFPLPPRPSKAYERNETPTEDTDKALVLYTGRAIERIPQYRDSLSSAEDDEEFEWLRQTFREEPAQQRPDILYTDVTRHHYSEAVLKASQRNKRLRPHHYIRRLHRDELELGPALYRDEESTDERRYLERMYNARLLALRDKSEENFQLRFHNAVRQGILDQEAKEAVREDAWAKPARDRLQAQRDLEDQLLKQRDPAYHLLGHPAYRRPGLHPAHPYTAHSRPNRNRAHQSRQTHSYFLYDCAAHYHKGDDYPTPYQPESADTTPTHTPTPLSPPSSPRTIAAQRAATLAAISTVVHPVAPQNTPIATLTALAIEDERAATLASLTTVNSHIVNSIPETSLPLSSDPDQPTVEAERAATLAALTGAQTLTHTSVNNVQHANRASAPRSRNWRDIFPANPNGPPDPAHRSRLRLDLESELDVEKGWNVGRGLGIDMGSDLEEEYDPATGAGLKTVFTSDLSLWGFEDDGEGGEYDESIMSDRERFLNGDGSMMDDGASMVDDGENVYEDGENVYDDGEDVYDDGENVYDDGEYTYDDDENIPEDSENVPEDSENVPEDSENVPEDSENDPDNDEHVYDDSETIPNNGEIILNGTKSPTNSSESITGDGSMMNDAQSIMNHEESMTNDGRSTTNHSLSMIPSDGFLIDATGSILNGSVRDSRSMTNYGGSIVTSDAFLMDDTEGILNGSVRDSRSIMSGRKRERVNEHVRREYREDYARERIREHAREHAREYARERVRQHMQELTRTERTARRLMHSYDYEGTSHIDTTVIERNRRDALAALTGRRLL